MATPIMGLYISNMSITNVYVKGAGMTKPAESKILIVCGNQEVVVFGTWTYVSSEDTND